ncbi:MAG: D-2-hydroxyacid dehydrogenase [Oscillospiraceae bacterium]|nr:D-2-hydroxyacid dehydrogenase [Oscillospiraceae bacterium]
MNTILVTLPVNGTQKAVLETAGENCRFLYETDSSKTEEMIPEADIIIGNVPAGDIHASPKLKLLQLQSAGTDGYTAPGVLSENTILTNATGAYDKTVAEHGLALTLMLQKNFYLYRDLQNQHIWKDMGMAASIADSTVVIVGYGSIGSLYAKMVKALGATVIGVKRRKSEKPEILDELVTMDELDNILPRADVVFSVLPNTPATRHLYTAERFAMMKPTAVFINCGRGNAVSAEVLYDVLQKKIIRAAACDVFEQEPLPSDSPLWSLENLVITPHTAGGFHLPDTKDKIIAIAAQNIRAVLGKDKYRNIIDFSTGYKK